jgi:hypothetical protein
MPTEETNRRYRRLQQMYRAAQAEHEHAHRLWEEARQELGVARVGLERATQGQRHGIIRGDEQGRAVRVVGREVRTPAQHGHMQIVDINYVEHLERVPLFDETTLRLHAAVKAEVEARATMNEAGARAGRFRRVVEQATEAMGRTALPSRPAIAAADPPLPDFAAFAAKGG